MPSHTVKPVPFKIDRHDDRTLVRQVVDGLRQAIVGGYYAPGDTLPPYAKLAPILGVSRIVTLTALRRLTAEGLVESRPRIGTVVRDFAAKRWRGHVVFVQPDFNIGYFQTMLVETLRAHLNEEGYLFTRASVDYGAVEGDSGFALLDAALLRSVDLAVVLYDVPRVARHLAELGVPYMVVGEGKRIDIGAAVGLTRIDYSSAVSGFVSSCLTARIRHVMQIGFDLQMCDAAPQLRAAGIDAISIRWSPANHPATLFDVEEAGRVGFTRLLESGTPPRDTALFFADDYLARGALTAMANAGLRAPEDIRFVTWANTGLGPAYVRDLSRMEINPRECGAIAAAAAIKYLNTGRYPKGTLVGPRWVAGQTLG